MLRSLLLGSALVIAATAGLAANPPKGEAPLAEGVDGLPTDFEKGDTARYGIYHVKDEGWHMHVTTAGKKRHFTGTIEILGDGSFDNVKEWQGNGKKKADVESAGWFSKAVKVDGKKLSFDIVSEDKHVSGLQFLVKGNGPLQWTLCVGGATEKDPVDCKSPALVKIGKDGSDAPAMPFRTFAHPDKEGKNAPTQGTK